MTSLLRGALAGLAGAFAMQQFRSAWNTKVAATPADGVYGLDDEADVNSVNLIAAKLTGRELEHRDALRIALILHFFYGAAAGSFYEWLVKHWPAAGAANGLTFGTLLWILGDECPIRLSGISPAASKTAASHASALACHLLYGVIVDAGRRQLG